MFFRTICFKNTSFNLLYEKQEQDILGLDVEKAFDFYNQTPYNYQ